MWERFSAGGTLYDAERRLIFEITPTPRGKSALLMTGATSHDDR